MISIITPATYDRIEEVKQIIEVVKECDNTEIIVCWDETGEPPDLGVKQVKTGREGYNLAMARNLGIIEAVGELIIFCDSRLKPTPEGITRFKNAVLGTPEKKWFYGDKGSRKEMFVENWSAIRKTFIVNAGMFNERIYAYGGMTKELNNRFKWQGFQFVFLPEAKAEVMKETKMTQERKESVLEMANLLDKLYR